MAKQEVTAFMLDPARPSRSMPDGGPARYDDDVAAWAAEQARLLRAGRFDLLDIEHIADEIEDVGKARHANWPAAWRLSSCTWQNGNASQAIAAPVGRARSACNVSACNAG